MNENGSAQVHDGFTHTGMASPVFEMHSAQDIAGLVLARVAMHKGCLFGKTAEWSTRASLLPSFGLVMSDTRLDHGRIQIQQTGDAVLSMRLMHGKLFVEAYGTSSQIAEDLVKRVRREVPPAEATEDSVDVTFWSLTDNGPMGITRSIAVPTWAEIQGNYAERVREGLGQLMDGPPPGADAAGKLILWHGIPGTGKTWAIRALASAWGEDCTFDYVIDPDSFFGDRAGYMVQVLHGQADSPIDGAEEGLPKSRLLILEDTGEMIAKDARTSVGQGLSRLLNLTDGLIGQGLRLSVLITTNEELGSLHDAVTRAGRCISNIDFTKLGPDETVEWAKAQGIERERGAETIANLYAEVEERKPVSSKQAVGFSS